MKNYCHSPTLILLFLLAALSNFGGEAKVQLGVTPRGVGPREEYYVASNGSELKLACELRTNESGDHLEGLHWMRGILQVQPTWMSMFTQPHSDPAEGIARLLLVIPQVDAKAAGEYRCVYFDELEKRIHVRVLDNINWVQKSDRVGASIGQSLTINCGASNAAEIKILNSAGGAIEDSANISTPLHVAGAELTIPKLGVEHQGLKVRCVAIRPVVLDAQNAVVTIHTDETQLTVDVWEPPQFLEFANGGRFYAVRGSAVVLRWTIRSSNPPVFDFTLKKDNKEIDPSTEGANSRYKIHFEDGKMASLSISGVEEEDYGHYTCYAQNGKHLNKQTVQLDKPKPPKQPRVWAEQVSNASVSWMVLEQAEPGLSAVTFFHINYRPLRRRVNNDTASLLLLSPSIDEFGDTEQSHHRQQEHKHSNKTEEGWEQMPPNTTHVSQMYRKKNPTNVYEIAGLEAHTEYEFIFVAGNQAGESDPLTLKQETMNNWDSTLRTADGLEMEHRQRADDHQPASGFAFSSRVNVRLVVLGGAVVAILTLIGLAVACSYNKPKTTYVRSVTMH